MIRRFLPSAAMVLAVAGLTITPASARQWNPDARGAALDYSQIVHAKSPGEVVVVWWVTPEAFPPGVNNQVIQDVLSRYVVLGIAHGRTSNTGQMSFDPFADLRIADSTARSLAPLSANAMPPEVMQTIGGLQALARQSLGPIGQGIRWFVFDGSTIHACSPGKMSVPLDGETYTYDTPIPGCPK
jgi:hypothetical protein